MQEALQVHEEMRNFEFGDPPARSGLWILSHFVATWVWRHQYGQMALTLGYVSSICTDHQPLLGCNWWILNWSTFITIRFSRLKKSRLQLFWPLYGYFMQEKINRYANFSHNNYKNCLCITNSDRKIPILCKDYSFSICLFFSVDIMVFYFLHFVFFQVQYIHYCWKYYVERLRRNFYIFFYGSH